MPIYVYRCANCAHEVEELQHVSDPPLVHCPHCGQDTLHKVVANVGIIFKGSGFYVTDNPHSTTSEGRHHKSDSDSNSTASSSAPEKSVESKESAPASSDANEGKGNAKNESSGDSSNKVA